MNGKAQDNVAAFHTWHSPRTYPDFHPEMDTWTRDVYRSLQRTLQLLAKQIDEQQEQIERLEHFARQVQDYLQRNQ